MSDIFRGALAGRLLAPSTFSEVLEVGALMGFATGFGASFSKTESALELLDTLPAIL
jgi:protein-L-isoaspartate O-methyltransferase